MKIVVVGGVAGGVNRQGRIAADHVCSRPSRYRGTLGTAIVKAFEMSGGGTGASEKVLRQLRRPYRKVYLHPSGHARPGRRSNQAAFGG
jgi:NADPH-dependent 2,4-dienoyl-CoA reductase/sulfur reductase-like enzyme